MTATMMCTEDMAAAHADAAAEAAAEALRAQAREARLPRARATGRQTAYLLDLLERNGYPRDVLTPGHWEVGLRFSVEDYQAATSVREVIGRMSTQMAHRVINELGG